MPSPPLANSGQMKGMRGKSLLQGSHAGAHLQRQQARRARGGQPRRALSCAPGRARRDRRPAPRPVPSRTPAACPGVAHRARRADWRQSDETAPRHPGTGPPRAGAGVHPAHGARHCAAPPPGHPPRCRWPRPHCRETPVHRRWQYSRCRCRFPECADAPLARARARNAWQPARQTANAASARAGPRRTAGRQTRPRPADKPPACARQCAGGSGSRSTGARRR